MFLKSNQNYPSFRLKNIDNEVYLRSDCSKNVRKILSKLLPLGSGKIILMKFQ